MCASEERFVHGELCALNSDGVSALSTQGTLTSAFVEFHNTAGLVRVARAVAVAETAGGASDQTAVVRRRQGGEDSASVSFYKVDDYTGAVGSLHAGDLGLCRRQRGGDRRQGRAPVELQPEHLWGWEDYNGGGDSDCNDLVVQFDFTSTAGHQSLV